MNIWLFLLIASSQNLDNTDKNKINSLINQLADKDYNTRNEAFYKLFHMGVGISPTLREALAKATKQRLKKLTLLLCNLEIKEFCKKEGYKGWQGISQFWDYHLEKFRPTDYHTYLISIDDKNDYLLAYCNSKGKITVLDRFNMKEKPSGNKIELKQAQAFQEEASFWGKTEEEATKVAAFFANWLFEGSWASSQYRTFLNVEKSDKETKVFCYLRNYPWKPCIFIFDENGKLIKTYVEKYENQKQEKSDLEIDKKINELIDMLGDLKPEVRDNATQELIQLGLKAFDNIKKLYKETKDPEIKGRSGVILDEIRRKNNIWEFDPFDKIKKELFKNSKDTKLTELGRTLAAEKLFAGYRFFTDSAELRFSKSIFIIDTTGKTTRHNFQPLSLENMVNFLLDHKEIHFNTKEDFVLFAKTLPPFFSFITNDDCFIESFNVEQVKEGFTLSLKYKQTHHYERSAYTTCILHFDSKGKLVSNETKGGKDQE